MEQYANMLDEIGVDGKLLFEITEEDLSQLGISIRLQRRKLLMAIEELKNRKPLPVEEAKEEEIEEQKQNELEVSEIVDEAQAEGQDANFGGQIHRINIEGSDPSLIALKAVEGQLVDNFYVLGQNGASLGRHSASNDIIISESFVSRKHCQVRYNRETQQFLISDLGSTTGTFLMIRKPQKLKLNSMFQMGLSEFRVNNIKYSPTGQASELELNIFEGPSKNQSLAITTAGLTIGRDVNNGFSVREDSQMSGFHARVFCDTGKFLLEDVGSTNRSWLRLSGEGERSSPKAIYVNDIIKLGSTVFLVQDFQVVEQHEQALKNIPEENICKICYSREANSAFYPCGHISCEECAYRCQNCPHCRRAKHDVLRLYKQ